MWIFFQKLTIKSKIFITFASVYIIVITIVGVLMYVSNVNEMKNQTQSMSKVLSTQFSQTIDMYIQDIERLSMTIFTDSVIQTLFSTYGESTLYQDITIRNDLYPRLFNQVYSHAGIVGIELYTNTGTVFDYSKDGDMSIRYETERNEWMDRLDQVSKSDFLLLPVSTRTTFNEGEEQVVSIARHIYEIPQRGKIGSLKIDININVFEELLQIGHVEELEEHMRVLIIDNEMNVIYDQNKELTGHLEQNFSQVLLDDQPSNDGTVTWQSSRYMFTNSSSNITNWNMVVLIDYQFIEYEQNQILLFVVITGLIAITSIALISYYLSYGITKPFGQLMDKMKRVEKGNLSARMKETGNSEIDVLIRVYNNMLNSIHKLITEVYESSITEKNAKISALQSQINPHFLYNTLNIMKSISRVKGVEEVAEISESLADLFKYSMKNLDKEVTLQEEITHVENYMRIQQHRFRDRFTLQVNMIENVKQASMPKLMLQPLVENAVNHGLKDVQSNGIVTVTAYQKGKSVTISVADNGAGMSEEKLQSLKKSLKQKENGLEETGVGLKNVSQRLRFMYGFGYQVKIESKVEEGTKVTIQLPYSRKGESL